MQIINTRQLDYDNIVLIPTQISTIDSRSYINPKIHFCGREIYPIISSPMPDVTNSNMAIELVKNGSYGFLERFMEPNEQHDEFVKVSNYSGSPQPHIFGCAIGLNRWEEYYYLLRSAGCKSFLIDCANAAHTKVIKLVEKLAKDDNYITIGNINSKENYINLRDLPIHAIRVGIAGGSACTTKLEAGIYRPMISTLQDVWSVKRDNDPLIIADGGIKKPADMNKALLWSDLVMCGSVFAKCKESPGKVIRNNNGKLQKVFRGAASYSTQINYTGKKPSYVEGMESLIDLEGDVESTINRFINGLRSSMSYMNARTLEEYRKNTCYSII